MKRKLFSIVALSIVATALVATAIGASTGPVGVVSLIEIDPKDKAQNEKNGDGRAPVLLSTHSFVEITQIERLRAFQACQKAGKTDCNTDKYRHEWSVPFITVENANKLEKALSLAWNRFDARVIWRMNTVINNFGVTPVPHRDYLIPTLSFSANCISPTNALTNQDTKLGAWDGTIFSAMKASDFCDGLSLDKAVSLASTHIAYPVPCGIGGGTVFWNEVARRYAEAMKHALTKYYPDYWIDVAKAFALYMPQALDWGGFGPTSSLVPGTEGGSLIAPVYASIPNPVQFVNLATKAAALDPLVGYSYIMQKYPYLLNPVGNSVLQNKGVLSLANITNEATTGIAQLEQLKYKLSTREDIFNRPYQWSLTGKAKPIGSEGVGTLREVEAIGYAPFLRVFSKVDTEVSPRPVILMVSCGQLVFTPFPNLVERVYPVAVSPAPMPVTYIAPRVHTQWMSVPEGYEIPKVKGVPSFKSLVGIGFSIPSLPTLPSLPTFETPTLPTTTTVTETLTKPLNLPAGYVVPVGNSITLPGGQVLNAGDTLKEAYTLPVGTAWAIDTAKKAATTAVTGGSSGTAKPATGSSSGTTPTSVTIPVPAPNTTTIPGSNTPAKPATGSSSTTTPAASVQIPVPAPNTTTIPGSNTKPTTPSTTTKPSTQPININESSNPTSTTTPTQTVTEPPAPTSSNTEMFPKLYKGVSSSHCVQMLNSLLYGVNAISVGTSKMSEFLDAVSEYGSATAGGVINYRKTQGFTASDSVDTTLWIDLFSRSNNDTGRALAVQIGLVAQGYNLTISGKWNTETNNALSDFASKKGLNATLNVKVLSALMQPCYDPVLSGSSSPSTPTTPTAPAETAPTSVAVQIRSSVYYPGCQRWDNSIKPGCNLSIEGAAIDARSASMPGSTYAVAIPAMNVYSEKKGGCQIPYGSVLKITNPRTGLSANATVRDGGPYVPGRNMDMTEPVARDIGFGETVDNVMVELVSVPAPYDNRATYCFGNSLRNGVNGGFAKNTSTIATGPTLGFPSYARK
jgi:hypothetical protein